MTFDIKNYGIKFLDVVKKVTMLDVLFYTTIIAFIFSLVSSISHIAYVVSITTEVKGSMLGMLIGVALEFGLAVTSFGLMHFAKKENKTTSDKIEIGIMIFYLFLITGVNLFVNAYYAGNSLAMRDGKIGKDDILTFEIIGQFDGMKKFLIACNSFSLPILALIYSHIQSIFARVRDSIKEPEKQLEEERKRQEIEKEEYKKEQAKLRYQIKKAEKLKTLGKLQKRTYKKREVKEEQPVKKKKKVKKSKK